MREFLPSLKEKLCGDGDTAMGTGLEHWKYLVVDLYSHRFTHRQSGILVADYLPGPMITVAASK